MIVEKTGNDHLKSKEIIQKKYFGMDALDDSIPLYGFVGRITEQKGIHLITDSAEEIIQRTKGKIQILIGGNHNHKEPYANAVGDAILKLRAKYPKNFWGDPDLFFTDGPNVNCGCDFGLMPSKFEPGGIV